MAEPSNNISPCPRCAELERRAAELEARVERLTRLLQQATRTAKQQAAPFSKGSPKPDPKPPGRKGGPDYGTSAFPAAPPPAKIDEVHEAVLPARCPACGGAVHETRVACQFQVEIPRKPIYRKFNVHVGQCTCCGQRVQGRHALQTSDALGAAACSLGCTSSWPGKPPATSSVGSAASKWPCACWVVITPAG